MRTVLWLLIVAPLVAPRGAAQWDPPDTLLAGITDRGRFLAAYDQAAWHATDAVMPLKPDPAVAGLMLAVPRPDKRWDVFFGRLTVAGDTFYIAYHAVPTARPDSFTVLTKAAPEPGSASHRVAATALWTALSDFGRQSRPYNVYALPRSDGSFFVYLLPAQTQFSEFLHGADIRYHVSGDGRRIVEKHRMHNALLNQALPDSATGGLHTVITADFPQDSDVLLVLARRPRRPEIIATAHHNYEIHANGTISWERADR